MTTIEFLAGEVRTGRRLTQLPVADGSWSMVINTAGDIEVKLPLHEAVVRERRTEILAQLEPTRCLLAVLVDGEHITEAGPIWTHTLDSDGVLTVKALGLWSLWDYRLVVRVLAAGASVAKSSLTWSNLSLGTIAKRLVSTAMAHTGGSLPLVLPADVAGPHQRTYPGFELAKLSERLTELAEVDGGPDIEFAPRLTQDRLGIEWVMRTGTPTDPLLHQTGDDWVWDSSAVRGPVGNITVEVDATGRRSRVYGIGSGVDEATLIGVATDPGQWDRGYPLLESTVSHQNVERQSTINAHARAAVGFGSAPMTRWKLRVNTATGPRLGLYRPGDWVQVTVPRDHVYLTPGPYRTRIEKVTGDVRGQFVDLALVPTRMHR